MFWFITPRFKRLNIKVYVSILKWNFITMSEIANFKRLNDREGNHQIALTNQITVFRGLASYVKHQQTQCDRHEEYTT